MGKGVSPSAQLSPVGIYRVFHISLQQEMGVTAGVCWVPLF